MDGFRLVQKTLLPAALNLVAKLLETVNFTPFGDGKVRKGTKFPLE
jgi:hypothetical protein